MQSSTLFSIYPLGDSAITIDLGNQIDEQLNRQARKIYEWLRADPIPGVLDIIMAYSTVSVVYDPVQVRMSKSDHRQGAYVRLSRWLEQAWEAAGAAEQAAEAGTVVRIPVCYEGEYAPDLKAVADTKGLSATEVIALHTARLYRIYMIGFLPGFPYMGRIDDRLTISRKDRPVPVKAGGVGIAGWQTGIYPLDSPGGWLIIGRTPVPLFDWRADPPVRLRPGDQVQFYAISGQEFLDWEDK